MTVSSTPHPSLLPPSRPGGASRADVMKVILNGYYLNEHHIIVGPEAEYHPVEPEASTQLTINPYSTILHSNAGPGKTPWWNLIAYWRRSDITGEAHFQIPMEGPAIQAIPLNRKADCNYKANRFFKNGRYVGAISFETGDNGHPTLANTPWTISQLGHLIRINTIVCIVYGVWCTPPTAWDDSGIGYHSQYKEWSSYVGKTCPGAARIRQIPWIVQAVSNNLAVYGEHTGWQCGGTYTSLPPAA